VRKSEVQNSAQVQRCKEENLIKGQMKHSITQMNALNKGNVTVVFLISLDLCRQRYQIGCNVKVNISIREKTHT